MRYRGPERRRGASGGGGVDAVLRTIEPLLGMSAHIVTVELAEAGPFEDQADIVVAFAQRLLHHRGMRGLVRFRVAARRRRPRSGSRHGRCRNGLAVDLSGP